MRFDARKRDPSSSFPKVKISGWTGNTRVAARIAAQAMRVPVQLYLQGYALQEIADLSELTLDAARKLVYRGLEETKQRLRALGLGEFDD